MIKIASHNSFTGEKGDGLLSFLVSAFSKCQSKTLVQQHRCGCRLFDLRVKWDKGRGRFVAAHGLWKAKKSLLKLMAELNGIAASSPVKTKYLLTYEGECEEGTEVYENFRKLAECLKGFSNIQCVQLSVKKPDWRVLWSSCDMPYYTAAYDVLAKDNWKTLLPIPWMWAKFRRKAEFSDAYYRMVDFL